MESRRDEKGVGRGEEKSLRGTSADQDRMALIVSGAHPVKRRPTKYISGLHGLDVAGLYRVQDTKCVDKK